LTGIADHPVADAVLGFLLVPAAMLVGWCCSTPAPPGKDLGPWTQAGLSATAGAAAAILLVPFLASLATVPWAVELWGHAFAATILRRRAVAIGVGASIAAVAGPLLLLGRCYAGPFAWTAIVPGLVLLAWYSLWLMTLGSPGAVMATIGQRISSSTPACPDSRERLLEAAAIARQALRAAVERGDRHQALYLLVPLLHHTHLVLGAAWRLPGAADGRWLHRSVRRQFGSRAETEARFRAKFFVGEVVCAWLEYASAGLEYIARERCSYRQTLVGAANQVVLAVAETGNWSQGQSVLGDVFARARKAGSLSDEYLASEWPDACDQVLQRIEDPKTSLGARAREVLRGVVEEARKNPPTSPPPATAAG
jgi:hypothetical protein